MKRKSRNRKILILMVVSQILLTGFMVQWLLSQYREEKSRLSAGLDQYYLESHDAMVDTLLFKSVIKPVLSHTSVAKGKLITENREFKRTGTSYAFGIKEDTGAVRKPGKAIITIRMDDRRDSLQSGVNAIPDGNANRDYLLRSVKLFIGSSHDSTGTINYLTDTTAFLADSSIFRANFIHHLLSKQKKFHISWNNIPLAKLESYKGSALVVKPIPVKYLPAAMVTNYAGYLLGSILPQILFGLLLVVITAISFLAAYRSIVSQSVLNEIRNDFISNMTHELKTPVSAMKIAIESLLNFNMKNDKAVTEEYLNLVSQETKRLEDLINKVLDHTFLEGNDHPVSFKQINAVTMIEAIVRIMSLKVTGKGSIRFVPEQPEIVFNGDQLYIEGVLLNLIDNSIKYCDKVPEILIEAGVSEGFAEIKVTDNGPGIPDEYRNKIFDKFFRVPTGDIHNIKGYGLGLSYAALVMKLHNGTIGLLNRKPGCTFILKFPL